MFSPVEVDHIEIRVLVNDQLDNNAASSNPEVVAPGRSSHLPIRHLDKEQSHARGNAKLEFSWENSCCGAHGLSLLVTVTKGGKKRTMLIDAGPEGYIFEQNVQRLKLEQTLGDVEVIHLSHWHGDHSSVLRQAINMIQAAKGNISEKVKMSLHPNRPAFRGVKTPYGPLSLEADPTVDELEAAGAEVILTKEDHLVLDDMFLISGEIPRVTPYETGFVGGLRFDSNEKGWEKDELIQDERFVMCNLKGKGLVVFTSCGHAGVVNTARRAVEVAGGPGLYTVLGGFHLCDSDKEKIEATVGGLKALEPKVIMPGHCTGWRFTVETEKVMPGVTVPLYGGQVYKLSA